MLDLVKHPNPSYLVYSLAVDTLDATTEPLDRRAALVSLRPPKLDSLPYIIDDMRIAGRLPCHIGLHPQGRWAACSRYGSGNVVVRKVANAGNIDPISGENAVRSGSGRNPKRQTRSHPHSACFSPDGR